MRYQAAYELWSVPGLERRCPPPLVPTMTYLFRVNTTSHDTSAGPANQPLQHGSPPVPQPQYCCPVTYRTPVQSNVSLLFGRGVHSFCRSPNLTAPQQAGVTGPKWRAQEGSALKRFKKRACSASPLEGLVLRCVRCGGGEALRQWYRAIRRDRLPSRIAKHVLISARG